MGKKKLTENIPNWKELINDENNWDKIKNVKARENNDDLWECFINAVGADLLNYCLVSSDDDLRVGAKSWLDEKFINKLDYIHPALIDLWKKLNEFGKRYVIDEVFERFSGELFEWHHRYLRYLEGIIYHSYDLHAARHLARLLGWVPLVAGYIP
ncbi:MAG: hypothetical protein QW156_05235 [Candidatus Aenigmatarchaeota archaeon]